ncbi:MAG: hypothetical protein WA435_02710 [Gallionellaceae bacterium]
MGAWSITNSSSVINSRRIDGEFYLPTYLENESLLSKLKTKQLPQLFDVSDGNHLSVSRHFIQSEGVPYYRGQDINDFFIENASPVRIPEAIFSTGMMRRSHFRNGDVRLSIVGTIGSLSLVPFALGNATGSCKIAILRPKGECSGAFLSAFLLCKYGQLQIHRNTRGAVQMGLILKDLSHIRIPSISENARNEVTAMIDKALEANSTSRSHFKQANHLLDDELGLDKLTFQKPVGYIARFSNLETSHRSDAQHYQPRFKQLIDHILSFPSARVRDIRTINRRGLQPIYAGGGQVDVVNSQHLGAKHIDYEGLEKTGTAAFAAALEAHIQQDDLLIYTTGAYIGRTNVYLSGAPAMASNHVNILRLKPGIDAAYMALVFQSIVGQFQTQQHSRGSAQAELYPSDIDRFVVPLLNIDKQKAIGDLVRESLVKQQESRKLLEQAKTRVEQLIEEAIHP